MDPAVRANAYAISYRLLGRPGSAGAVADAVAEEVDRTGGVETPEWLGFLAAEAVARSLAVAEEGNLAGSPDSVVDTGPHAGTRDNLRRRLRDATGEQRAAAALVHLAGYDIAMVADHLNLDEARVSELASVIQPPPGMNWRHLGDPALRKGSAHRSRPAAIPPGPAGGGAAQVGRPATAGEAPPAGPSPSAPPAATNPPTPPTPAVWSSPPPATAPQGPPTGTDQPAKPSAPSGPATEGVVADPVPEPSPGSATSADEPTADVPGEAPLGVPAAPPPDTRVERRASGGGVGAFLRRRRRGILITLVILAVIALVVLGVSRAVGPRPRLGEARKGVSASAIGAAVEPLPSSGCAATLGVAAPPGSSVRAVETPEGNRSYRLWVPPPDADGAGRSTPTVPGASTPTRPIVVAVPGYGKSADDLVATAGLESGLGTDMVVVTLDPLPPEREVNVAQDAARPDDVLYALAAFDDAVSHTCVDMTRTAVMGHGPGGQLAGVAACTEPRYFASVVAINGAYLPEGCRLHPPVSFLGIWTADDAVLPISGGYGVELPLHAPADPPPVRVPAQAADAVTEAWAQLVGADERTSGTSRDGTVTTRYEGGRDGSAVVQVIRPEGGHLWPTGIDARVRRFVDDHARASL